MSGTVQERPKGSDGARVIKRYANRKLYDTRDSRYVTLQQIAAFVRAGEDVRIVDNTTKEDLTQLTLAQIIYEEEKKGTESGAERRPSAASLRSLIQRRGERLITSLRDGPMGKLVPRKDGEEGSVADDEADRSPIAGVATAGSSPTGAPAAAELPLDGEGRPSLAHAREAWEELQRLADGRIRALVGTALGHVHQLQGEIRRLQERIDELERRLSRRAAADSAAAATVGRSGYAEARTDLETQDGLESPAAELPRERSPEPRGSEPAGPA